MGTTIIANNCIGAAIYQDMCHRYESPTINLQIMPWEFPIFCRYLWHFLHEDLKEVEISRLTLQQQNMLIRNYMRIPPIPYGEVDGILICFEHYEDFSTAKWAWDKRKERVDYKHVGNLFYVNSIARKALAEYFVREYSDVPNPVVLTQGFEIEGGQVETHRVDVPRGKLFLDCEDRKRIYSKNFNVNQWWGRILTGNSEVKGIFDRIE